MYKFFTTLKIGLSALVLVCMSQAGATGVYRDGLNAESASLAGINVQGSRSPLSIMTGNPAGLAKIDQSVTELNFSLASFDTSFTNIANTDRASAIDKGVIPAAALVLGQEDSRYTWGFSVTPDIALETRYQLVDPMGGLAGVSYGSQKHASKFVAVRFAAGGAVSLTDRLDLGVSIGAIWNQNKLEAPYIFQDGAPSILPGFKTLLDLQTEGWSWAAQLGLSFAASDELSFGLSYRPETRVRGTGSASGNAGAQLDQLGVTGFQQDFRYHTEIKTRIPAVISVGLAWQVSPDWTLLTQFDQVKSSAYDNLRIDLSEGNNADLNNLLGADGFVEVTPLHWDDQNVVRIGVRYQVNTDWLFQAGFSSTSNPIPSATLTPLTGSISENTFGFGLIHSGQGSVLGLAYQYVQESEQSVTTSDLLAGEYSNSRFALSGHWINISWQF